MRRPARPLPPWPPGARALGLALAVAACAPAGDARAPRAPAADLPDAATRPADATRHYTLWLAGARIGTATEDEAWTDDGVVLRRTERLRYLRADAAVELETTLEIAADRALVPARVTWIERGAATRRVDALRTPRGWRARDGALRAELARVPDDAIPAELVPLRVRRDGRFAGPVFLPARGFVAGAGHVAPLAAGRLVARLALDAGPVVEATLDLGADGAPALVVDGEGVIARRASAREAAAAFPLVDLIAATAVPLAGARTGRLALAGQLAAPPVPGQAAHPAASGLVVDLSPALPGALPPGPRGADRRADIAALVGTVRARIAPALAVGPASPHDAEAARAGDCTTYALAYATLAGRLGIPTRVVTGLRVDGARLVRHRWAVSWTGAAWVAVDAAFGAVPAGGDLVGLAVHDADDAGLLAGEAALGGVLAAAWQ